MAKDANAAKGEVDNVRVAVRCRPMVEKELEKGCKSIVCVDQACGEVTVTVPNPKATREPKKVFTFDNVFGAESSQAELYNETARRIVDAVLQGYNGTIFAYGQTGTGKTHTMVGEKKDPELRGVIPNSFAHIFGHISKSEGQTQFLVRVSYLEIYNEDVRDLLSRNLQAKLEVRERSDIGVYVKDLCSFVVKNVEDMEKLMAVGAKNRTFGTTDMNEHSSRSHTIFTITVEQSEIGPDKQQHVRMGKLHLVDLAGSERLSKTGATGIRKDEAASINRSLSNLGIVISALVDGKSTHIPYRNSKLTRLLQDSLGGNSKTVMIANIGPADYNSDESLNTLRYANRAKNIQNSARINEDPKDAMLREFQKEIEALKRKLTEASGSEGESSEDDEESAELSEKRRQRRKKGRRDSAMSPRHAAELRDKIQAEQRALMATKDMAVEERDKVMKDLERKELELRSAQEEYQEMEERLKNLESKVIVGGINLLEEAEKQDKLLEKSRKELEKKKAKETALREKLKKKQDERIEYEEKFANLQEAAEGVTHQLKAVWRRLQTTKDELAAAQVDFQREKEDLLDSVRHLDKQLGLQSLLVDSFVPQEFQDLIEQHAEWDEQSGEWHVHGIAYAGNNMHRDEESKAEPPVVPQMPLCYMSSPYLNYPNERRAVAKSTSSSSTTSRAGGSRKVSLAGSTSSQQPDIQYPTPRGLLSRQKHFA